VAYPNDSNTVLLLHCDGSDAHTTFTDNSVGGNGGETHTVTANGNAQGDTTQYKFGSASALFDGTGDYLSAEDHADWNFGGNPFTIDFWVRFNALPTAGNIMCLVSQYADSSNYWVMQLRNITGQYYLGFAHVASGSSVMSYNKLWTTPAVDTWYHGALIRGWGSNDNVFAFTIDGILVDSTFTDSDSISDISGALEIGAYAAGTSNAFNGWMDEIRICKGTARWTANFDTYSIPYPNSETWMGTINAVKNPTKVYGITTWSEVNSVASLE